ncbi:hypothetical protein KI387_023952, partial [Taxus chinensis]
NLSQNSELFPVSNNPNFLNTRNIGIEYCENFRIQLEIITYKINIKYVEDAAKLCAMPHMSKSESALFCVSVIIADDATCLGFLVVFHNQRLLKYIPTLHKGIHLFDTVVQFENICGRIHNSGRCFCELLLNRILLL